MVCQKCEGTVLIFSQLIQKIACWRLFLPPSCIFLFWEHSTPFLPLHLLFFAFVRYHQKSRPESWRFPGSPVVFMMPAGVWMYLSYKEQYYQIFQIPSSSPNANHFSPAAFSSRFIMAAPIPVLDVAVARMMVASVLSQLRRASYRFAPICS